jgi:hypothetical protein
MYVEILYSGMNHTFPVLFHQHMLPAPSIS